MLLLLPRELQGQSWMCLNFTGSQAEEREQDNRGMASAHHSGTSTTSTAPGERRLQDSPGCFSSLQIELGLGLGIFFPSAVSASSLPFPLSLGVLVLKQQPQPPSPPRLPSLGDAARCPWGFSPKGKVAFQRQIASFARQSPASLQLQKHPIIIS